MAQIIEDVEKQSPNEYLTELAKQIKENPPVDTNGGHDALMLDLSILLKEANDYSFHDYKNEKYPAPKVALGERLMEIRQNMIDGKYDN